MILVVSSRFDKTDKVIKGLEKSCFEVLEKNSVGYIHVQVPGAVEIPVTIQTFLRKNKKFRAAIALGCIIKGETSHYEWVMNACERGLTRVSLDENIPVIQGVLACLDDATAIARKHHGTGYAETAIEMTTLL
jgi:6,7-dimethyl-8-ribityllumazine synthase